MKTISYTLTIFEMACKQQEKWGLLLHSSWVDGDWTYNAEKSVKETKRAVPYLDIDDITSLLLGEHVFCFFDTEEEARGAFDRTVGDDGPTKKNKYKGPANVYAVLVSPTEGSVTENT